MNPTIAALAVARDAAEEGREDVRVRLLDELCEVEWSGRTFAIVTGSVTSGRWRPMQGCPRPTLWLFTPANEFEKNRPFTGLHVGWGPRDDGST